MSGTVSFTPGAEPLAYLTTDEMIEAAQVFLDSYAHVVTNLVGTQKVAIQKFVSSLVLREKAYLMLTPEGLQRAVGEVFENEERRDFVFTLFYTFGSRWSMSQQRLQMLAANLAVGVSPVTQLEQCLVPNALASRLVSVPDAYNLLVANQWLVVLLLLMLFLQVPAQDADTK